MNVVDIVSFWINLKIKGLRIPEIQWLKDLFQIIVAAYDNQFFWLNFYS